MSLINSLFAGVSGLRNHQSMMDVIGNNIANVNTIGFKGSRVTFSDTFNQFIKAGSNPTETSGGTNTFQIGLGMKINSIDRNWTQGTFDRTGITTDIALQGDGMFILKSGGQNFYSRAGAFSFDADGKLVNPQNGAVVQGKVANGNGEIPAGNTLQDIQIDNNLRLAAIATTNASWGGNLSSSAPVTQSEIVRQSGNINSAGASPFSPADTTIYDVNGNAYKLRTTYTRTAANNYDLTYDILDSTTGVSLLGAAPAAIPVVFDGTTGAMTTYNGVAIDATHPATTAINQTVNGIDMSFDLSVGAVTQNAATTTLSSSADGQREPTIVTGTVSVFDSLGNSNTLTIKFTKTSNNNWNWNATFPDGTVSGLSGNSGNIIFNPDGSIQSMNPATPTLAFTPEGGANPQTIELDFGEGLTGISQTSATSNVSALNQNGSASATLSNINIDQYGNIVGVFSNGFSRTLAQIMTATFTNRAGLEGVGNSMYTVSANSGNPLVLNLGDESGTTIQSGALEQSNVDLSEEFTKMIISQRGFQANARVITTADTLLQEITNLVR